MCIVMLIEYTIHLCMVRLDRFQSLCDETFAVCDKILLKASSHRDCSHQSRVWFIQVWSLREWHLQASIKNHPVMINSQPDWISVARHSVCDDSNFQQLDYNSYQQKFVMNSVRSDYFTMGFLWFKEKKERPKKTQKQNDNNNNVCICHQKMLCDSWNGIRLKADFNRARAHVC